MKYFGYSSIHLTQTADISREQGRKAEGSCGITIDEPTANILMDSAEFPKVDRERAASGRLCWLLGTVGIAKHAVRGWLLVDGVRREV